MDKPEDLVTGIREALKSTDNDLTKVVATLEELRKKRGKELVDVATACGDASRDVEWRGIFGEKGVLTIFMDILHEDIDNELACQTVRVIANSVADHNENRQRVVDHPHAVRVIISLVRNEEVYRFATATLQNLMLDYEPAQLKAIEEGACGNLVDAITDKGDADIQVPLRVLEMLFSHDIGRESCPTTALNPILRKLRKGPLEMSFEDYLSILTMLSALLTTQTHQQGMIRTESLFPSFLDIFDASHRLIFDPSLEIEDRKLLFRANSALMDNIGDISWQEGFLDAHPLDSQTFTRLMRWLDNEEEHRFDRVIGACLVLGNAGRTQEVCGRLIGEYSIHKTLFRVVKRAVGKYHESKDLAEKPRVEDAGSGRGGIFLSILHSTLGVLRNLAVPKVEKNVLGADGVFDVIREVLAMEGVGVAQAWYSAAGLSRMLCVGSPENCKRIVNSQSNAQSYLSCLLEIYSKAEELPTKTEIARTIVSALRSLSTPSSPAPSHPGMARPLWDMVLQDKWPVIRSEGLLGLALLARSEGATELCNEWGDKEMDVLWGLSGKDLENTAAMIASLQKSTSSVEEMLRGKERADLLLQRCLNERLEDLNTQDEEKAG